jgi:membrane-bound acyltransferase YfiQ involved in biofilm formation
MVLLIFRRHLQSLFFGGVLLAASLFYSLNIYTQWIETHHTRAFFGFIFYLWLGHYAAINMGRFTQLLRSLPTGALLVATLISAFAAFGEGRLLVHLHAPDPLNTLKVTTQIFSVLVFLCFFKYQRPIWPACFDVPRTTFGMYLAHVLTLAAFTSPLWMLMNGTHPHPFLGSFAMRVAIWLATTALTAAVSLVLARALAASPTLGWIVGSPRPAGSGRVQDRSSIGDHRSAKAEIATAS